MASSGTFVICSDRVHLVFSGSRMGLCVLAHLLPDSSVYSGQQGPIQTHQFRQKQIPVILPILALSAIALGLGQ